LNDRRVVDEDVDRCLALERGDRFADGRGIGDVERRDARCSAIAFELCCCSLELRAIAPVDDDRGAGAA
jgi:hypothetical protein